MNLTVAGSADWVHWGLLTDTSIDRKVNVAPRISNFTPVAASGGYVYIYQFADNANGYTWTDGTPHLAVTNTTTGVWAYGVPAADTGFRFSVPASTNVQTLKVYVGAFAAQGKFVAFLSDASAPNYTNSTAVDNNGNGPSAVYTLNFAANSPGQTLTVFYTLARLRGSGGGGNVTLQAAALSTPGLNNLPFVALTNPEDRASFSPTNMIVLSATAGDADGTVSAVEFFAASNKIGQATSAPYSIVWTNPQPGSYVLTARAIDNAGGVGISSRVTVFVGGPGGALSGTRSNSPAAVNLTAEGTSDWAHWGALTASSFDHKSTGNGQISNFTLIGSNVVTRYDNNYTAFSWSDGVPLATTNGSTTGLFVTGAANGFEISAPADTRLRTLKVYTGLYGAQANFEAFLTDFSGRAFTDTSLSNVFGNRYVVYTIDYAAASPGQRLIVRQTIGNAYDFTYGNVTLQAATLQLGALTATNVPPVVSITNPVNNAVLTAPATFTLEATASDSDGSVTQVEFFNGAVSVGADTTSPYAVTVSNLADGTYAFSSVATDNQGAKTTNSITITVNALPTVTMNSPINHAIFSAPATFTIAASASDSDGTVSSVEFYAGTTVLGVDAAAPFNFTVSNLSVGTYSLTALATDNRGASTTSSPISITVVSNTPSAAVIFNPRIVGEDFVFSFETRAATTYTVEFTDSLSPINWQFLTNFSGDGTLVTITNRTSPAAQRFFRAGAQSLPQF